MSNTEKNDAKYLMLRETLREFITKNPPGTRLPSYAEMIRIYGVGQSTIDRAMREFDEAKLIQREHGRGMFISPRAGKKNIAIIFGRNVFNSISPVNQRLLECAEARSVACNENTSFFINIPQVKANGFELLVQRDLLDAVDSGLFSGMLLVSTRGPTEVEWLSSKNIPLVVMTNRPGRACGVFLDIGEVVRQGTEALAKQGCRRIALLTICGHKRNQKFFDDLDSYHKVLSRHKLEQHPEWVWDDAAKPPEHTSEITITHEMLGRTAADEMLKNLPLAFDGLVSMDDMATRGFISRMKELNLIPGRDLKIATHVNRGVPVLSDYERDITMIEVDPSKMVDAAFALLSRLMSGEAIKPGYVELVKDGIREISPT